MRSCWYVLHHQCPVSEGALTRKITTGTIGEVPPVSFPCCGSLFEFCILRMLYSTKRRGIPVRAGYQKTSEFVEARCKW